MYQDCSAKLLFHDHANFHQLSYLYVFYFKFQVGVTSPKCMKVIFGPSTKKGAQCKVRILSFGCKRVNL